MVKYKQRWFEITRAELIVKWEYQPFWKHPINYMKWKLEQKRLKRLMNDLQYLGIEVQERLRTR